MGAQLGVVYGDNRLDTQGHCQSRETLKLKGGKKPRRNHNEALRPALLYFIFSCNKNDNSIDSIVISFGRLEKMAKLVVLDSQRPKQQKNKTKQTKQTRQ